MKNKQQGFSEHGESFPHYVKQELSLIDEKRDQLLLEQLLDRGFVWEEAIQLINLREHLYENIEIRQRMTDDCHIQFARWLYQHGELKDN